MAQTEAQIYAKLLADAPAEWKKDPTFLNDLKAEAHTTAQAQTTASPVVASSVPVTASAKVTNTAPAAADQTAKINAQYTQYQVQLANDLKSGKITQAQFQNEFEKLRAQQAASLAKVPASSTLTAAEKAKLGQSSNPPSVVAQDSTPTSTATEVGQDQAAIVQAKPVFKGPPIPNPLLDYPSYTYGLSLAMLTKKEYNDVVRKPTSYVPNRVLIASAGRYNNTAGPNQFIRSSFFNEDFYFENLNMKTVIGMNDHNRATNAVEMSFSIMEPYGMTLLNRIIDLCASPEINTPNYTEQPYMLQIDFFATNNAGEIIGAIPGQTKRIPIRILTLEIKASSKGSEYQITAAAYNHSAYDVGTVQTPAHFEIAAGTLSSMFQGNEPETAFTDVAAQRETTVGANGAYNQAENGTLTVRGGTGEVVGLALMGNASAATINSVSKDPVYDVKSYGSAINAWNAELVKTNKISHADVYKFNFHPDFADSKLVLEKKLGPKDTQMANVKDTVAVRKGNVGEEIAAMTYNSRIFSINTGTSIDQVINFVMRNSHYIQDQLVVPEDFGADMDKYVAAKAKTSNLPLNWYKIVPTVELGEYDEIKGTWARTITYNVIPYTVYNAKLSTAPQGVIEWPVKEHNYWYTGKNDDILDFNVEFKALYYNATTAYKGSMGKIAGAPDASTSTTNPENYNASADPTALQKQKERPETSNSAARATGGDTNIHQIAASDVEQSLYSNWSGDMVGVTLKIIGDPQYIKQDDIFHMPNMTPTSAQVDTTGVDPRLIENGSLDMDSGEVYIQITFRTPTDIDDSTGLMKFESKYGQSVFSGMYKVLTVDNVFSGGTFTQTLNIVRLPRQTMYDYVNKPKSVSTERTTTPGASNALDNYDIAPNMSAVNKTTGDVTAPGSAPDKSTAAPTTTAEQAALAKVSATAPEAPINSTTAPQAVVNPNASKIAELNSQLMSVNGEIGQLNNSNSSRSLPFLTQSAASFEKGVAIATDKYNNAVAAYGADSAIAVGLSSDVAFNQRQLANFSSQAAAAQQQLTTAQAKAADLQSQIAALS